VGVETRSLQAAFLPRKGGETMSLCIECAVQYHDFREIPSPVRRSYGSGNGTRPQAFIDGKKHSLNQLRLYHVPCDHCHRVSGALFVSTDEE
jgi:hypothetical protein